MQSPTDNLIIYPDTAGLKAEVEKLRTELSMRMLDRDELLYQECKNIEMAYLLAVGGLEYRAYELECLALRLKRKVELLQAARNRQEKINVPVVELILDEEFAEYQTKLEEQISRMNQALQRSKGEVLTEAEAREIKKLYRLVVKALHPDLRPDLSPAKLELFRNAVEAYKAGDLETMRIISAMVAEELMPEDQVQGLAYLVKEKEQLAGLIQGVKRGIDEIKARYPYTVKPVVESPKKIALLKAELQERIESLTEIQALYQERIEELLR